MKSKYIIILIAIVSLFVSCSKDLNEKHLEYPALQPANIDVNAGTWKPVLLTGPTEFSVAAPALQYLTNSFSELVIVAWKLFISLTWAI